VSTYRIFTVLLTAIVLAQTPAAFAQSQANTGSIEGVVTDPSDRVVTRASVTLTNTGTNFTRSLQTDETGRFRGLLLPLGPYKVTVQAPGFGVAVREGLDLAVGQTISLPVALTVSQTSEIVSVTAEAPIIESERVENSTYLIRVRWRNFRTTGGIF
jgi:hypothetical protein